MAGSGRIRGSILSPDLAPRHRSESSPSLAGAVGGSSGGWGESLVELGIRAGFGSDGPERIAVAAERRSVLDGAVASLDPEDREILILRHIEAIPGEKCASALGLSVPAMKSRLHRARLRLVAAVHRATGERSGR